MEDKNLLNFNNNISLFHVISAMLITFIIKQYFFFLIMQK